MKKTDIAAIVLISIITTITAYFIGNAVLGDPNTEKVTVNYLEVIEAGVAQPDPEVFSPNAVNPTVEIYIGNCPEGQIWDSDTQTCNCPEGQTWDTTSQTCVKAQTENNSETGSENSETGE